MRKEILVVENAAPTIDTIKSALESPFIGITVVSEGETAKKQLGENKYDLLVTADMLPKFHGFNLSLHAVTHYPGIKVIIIGDKPQDPEDYRHQAIDNYKADDFLEKPLDPGNFKKKALQLLGINRPQFADQGSNTIQLPISEPHPEKKTQLDSEDIFGDILAQVNDLPSYEIKLDDDSRSKNQPPPSPPAPPAPNKTQQIDLDELNHLMSQKTEAPAESDVDGQTRQIDLELLDRLMKEQTAAKAAPPTPDNNQYDEVGGYDILGLIARGGMAEIYKAKKKGVKGFEKTIAIKKILSGYGADDKYVEMFVDEAKIAAGLNHPNIVHIYDLGKKDDYYFIAMEYVAGKDLRLILQKLEKTGEIMPEEFALYLAVKVLEGLNYAHNARDSKGQGLNIVHRDVSPPNILVSYDGNIKLLDFGVSKASIKMHETVAGALKGKVQYMSPEQARGEGDIDSRADLYSVGTILFELLTGRKLFNDPSEMGTLKKVQEGAITRPSEVRPDIDPRLEAILLRALDADRTQRYQRASEMITALGDYMRAAGKTVPDAGHIAHFVSDLFEEDIIREGMETETPPPSPPSPNYSTIPIKVDAMAGRTVAMTAPPETRARPITRIELDGDDPAQGECQKTIQVRLPGSADGPPEAHTQNRKKITRLVVGVILTMILAAVIIYFLLTGDSSAPGRVSMDHRAPQPGQSEPTQLKRSKQIKQTTTPVGNRMNLTKTNPAADSDRRRTG